jgi:hypothetical protein
VEPIVIFQREDKAHPEVVAPVAFSIVAAAAAAEAIIVEAVEASSVAEEEAVITWSPEKIWNEMAFE